MKINVSFKNILKLVTALLLLSVSQADVYHAKVIDQGCGVEPGFSKDGLDYTFKVGTREDKSLLFGTGMIKLSASRDKKMKGIATGIGMTHQGDIDFLTNLKGEIDDKHKVILASVNGVGIPIGILKVSKISFNGKVKGFLKEEKLTLVGKVNIEGKLAHLAGFKDVEDLLIEIPISSINTYVLALFDIALSDLTKL